MVHPLDGGIVPEDKPIVVLRFAPGEPADAIDTRSLVVTVDGEDRTALFQFTGTEAWGPIVAPAAKVSRGAREIRARICSARGACASTKATVVIGPSAIAGAGNDVDAGGPSRKSQVLDVLITAVKALLKP